MKRSWRRFAINAITARLDELGIDYVANKAFTSGGVNARPAVMILGARKVAIMTSRRERYGRLEYDLVYYRRWDDFEAVLGLAITMAQIGYS